MSARDLLDSLGDIGIPFGKGDVSTAKAHIRNKKGKRRITTDTALRFSKYFGTSAKFWLGLQDDYDREEEINQKMEEIESIKPLEESAAL